MGLTIKPHYLKRYREIATLLTRHGRGDLVCSARIRRVLDEESPVEGDPQPAERLADDLEAMGPTYIKLGQQADNLVMIGNILSDEDRIVVPRPFADFTTGRLLTMEYAAGKKVTELGPLSQLDLDGTSLADAIFSAYLKQVLVEGVFHADPHPGNVLVTPDGRLALVDIGMVVRITPDPRDKLVKPFLALADAGPVESVPALSMLGERLSSFDPVTFERSVADVVGRSADASLSELDVGTLILQLTRTAADCGLLMDPELSMLHRSPAVMLVSILEAKAFDEYEFLRGLHKLANVIATSVVLAAMILASALLTRSPNSHPTAENRIALVVFVISVMLSLAMLVRIVLQTRHVRARHHE